LVLILFLFFSFFFFLFQEVVYLEGGARLALTFLPQLPTMPCR
jgi:hypothetical protein